MTRRVLVLNLALLALLGLLGWRLRARWVAAKAREQAVYAQRIQPKAVLAPPLPQPAKPFAPSEYVEVAQNTLFSKDRNPNVVVEPPKPAPEPAMPPLPHYHGQMNFGEPIALLSVGNSAQKGYHTGDKIGDFTIVTFNNEVIDLEWRGKKVEKKLVDLVAKEAPPQAGNQPSASAAPSALPSNPPAPSSSVTLTAPVTSLGGAPSAASPSAAKVTTSGTVPAAPGEDIGGGMRGCVPGDDSPSGTVSSGYRKNIVNMMFAKICRWEPVQ